MQKSKLTGFISRFHLAGQTESAKLTIKDNTIKTEFITDDNNVIGNVELRAVDAPDAELSVGSAASLSKILGALDEEMSLELNMVSGNCHSISCKDEKTLVTYLLSEASTMKQVPALKALPDFEVKIKINKDFTTAFKKAYGALGEASNLGITSDGIATQVIINYSTTSSNRITFDTVAEETAAIQVVCFAIKPFGAILTANSDCEGLLEVSSKGIGRVTFTGTDYTSTYYLVRLRVS